MPDDTEFAMPTPDPALKRLDFLVGDWTLTGRTIEGPMGPAAEVAGWERFFWMEGGFFLVHVWESRFAVGGQPVVDAGYEFLDYDSETGQYRTHFFNSLGPYDPAGSHYAGTFEGDALVVTGPARISRKPDTGGSITVFSDVVSGNGAWLPFMAYQLRKKA